MNKKESCEQVDKRFTCEDCEVKTNYPYSISMEGEHLKTVCNICRLKYNQKDNISIIPIRPKELTNEQ